MSTMLREGAPRSAVDGRSVRYDIFPIPALRWPIECYIENRSHAGSFLDAIARNDLRLAVLTASPEAKLRLGAVVDWFHHNAPADCWGSPEAVDRWLNPT